MVFHSVGPCSTKEMELIIDSIPFVHHFPSISIDVFLLCWRFYQLIAANVLSSRAHWWGVWLGDIIFRRRWGMPWPIWVRRIRRSQRNWWISGGMPGGSWSDGCFQWCLRRISIGVTIFRGALAGGGSKLRRFFYLRARYMFPQCRKPRVLGKRIRRETPTESHMI